MINTVPVMCNLIFCVLVQSVGVCTRAIVHTGMYATEEEIQRPFAVLTLQTTPCIQCGQRTIRNESGKNS